MRRTYYIALLAACVAGLVLYFGRSGNAHRSETIRVQTQPVAKQPTRVSAAHTERAALPAPELAASGAQIEEHKDIPADITQPPTTAVDQVAYVDSVFQGEVFDAGWARTMEVELGNELKERAGNSTIDSFECRQTLCKARVSHATEEEFQRFVERAFGPPAMWKGAAVSLREPASADGRIHATLFFAKLGEGLPILEE